MKLKTIIFNQISLFCLFLTSCNTIINPDKIRQEIYSVEKEFEAATLKAGIAEAFYFYADTSAVIHRQNDTLIKGKEKIRNFYLNNSYKDAIVNWTPDFVDVSADGTLGYTYGRYRWKIKDADGKINEYTGIFHTVWKKQSDGTWKYVWD